MQSRANTEEQLYEQVEQYLQLKYPAVMHHWDLSGIWTPSHRLRNLYGRLNRRAFPDLFIYKSTMLDGTTNPSAGLAIELKREGTRLYKRDGSWASPHIAEQAAVLDDLANQGYYTVFAVGYDEAVRFIDAYLTPMSWARSRQDEGPF